MKRLSIVFFVISLTFLLGACGGEDAESSPLEESSWELVHYGFGEIVLSDAVVTAEFTDGRISGFTGCNDYSAGYEVGDGTITVSEIAVTERACLDEAVMEQERAFLDALQSVGHYVLEAETLTMNYSGGVLVFQNPNSVAGAEVMASWR